MSMAPGNSIALPGLRDAKAFYLLLIALVVVPVATTMVPALRPVAEASAYVLPIGLVLITAIVYRLMMAGTMPIPGKAFIGGAAFIAGGAGFDIIATLIHSPDLSRESNPIARLLLDSGKSVEFVLVFGAVCQSLATIASILLWGGLLSHRATIIESIRDSSQTFSRFLRAILGGKELTWKQFLFPRIFRYPGDRSQKYYYYPWMCAPMLLGGACYRWYLGIEWFGFSPIPSTVVAVGSMLLALAAYIRWGWCAVQAASESTVASDNVPASDGPS